MKHLLSIILVAIFFTTTSAQAERPFKPVDQAASQPDFFTFRSQLLSALAQKNVEVLLTNVADDIVNSFGGSGGIEEFKREWKLNQPNSPLWTSLFGVLTFGGSFDSEGAFVAPYTFSEWPDEVDSLENGAIIGSKIRVRDKPDANASIIGSLSFTIVPWSSPSERQQWVEIRLSNGQKGFVDARYIKSPLDYRAIFKKRNGKWLLTHFVAGIEVLHSVF